jgi:ABC-type phosphate transport system substrate-binding protein
MKGISSRRIFTACAFLAALVAFAVPGIASAKGKVGKVGEKCSSEKAIVGEGSSAQKVAQQNVWIPGFEKSKNPDACSGTQGGGKKPTLKYEPNGSGSGLKAFGAEGETKFHGKTVQYAGTDEPPNKAQKEEIESHEEKAGEEPEALYTLPVLQFSVTVIVHLPEGCTASSLVTGATGRLALGNETLYKIWNGELTTWGAVIAEETKENPGAGDKITGSGSKTTAECEAATITLVVRFDQSGTSHVFKKYLALIEPTPSPQTFERPSPEPPDAETLTWKTAAEGTGNQKWPASTHARTIMPTAKGGGEEAKLVAETPSSIGYVNLPEARASKFVAGREGGEGTSRFWVALQNSGTASQTKSGKKQKYAEPSTNAPITTEANANCVKEKYTNGEGAKFPPKSTKDTWNNVTTGTKQKEYPLCGLTYDLAVTPFKIFVEPPEPGQATTVVDYLSYVLNEEPEGGQVNIVGHDYERIPAKIDKEAREGLAEVSE